MQGKGEIMPDLYTYLNTRIGQAFEKYTSIFSIIDYAIYMPLKGIIEEAERDITCKKGCSHCCSRIVVASRLEALALAEYIEAHSGEEFNTLIDHINTHAETQKNFIDERSEKQDEDAIWFNKQIPCPLLKDGICSMYEGRPLSCRIHNSLDDPEKCLEPVRNAAQHNMLVDAESLFKIFVKKIAERIEESLAVESVLSISLDTFFQAMRGAKTDDQ